MDAVNLSSCKSQLHKQLTYVRTRSMDATSSISAIKVETPFSCESPAPTRAKMESTMHTEAELQGTKHPIWAISTVTPIWGEGENITHRIKSE
jgi:hypothetical protein